VALDKELAIINRIVLGLTRASRVKKYLFYTYITSDEESGEAQFLEQRLETINK